jgi:isopenicillin N synthase-like dioxygenase
MTQTDELTGTGPAAGAPDFEAAAIVAQLSERGYATVRLTGANQAAHLALRAELAQFFDLGDEAKLKYACPDFHYGFRPYGRQYSATPDRPDLNESFAYWFDRPELVPGHGEIEPLLSAMHEYWAVLAELSRIALSGIAGRFGSDGEIGFEGATHLEANSYFGDVDRDLLQDRHEDGHLFTIVSSDGAGLELETDGVMTPFGFPGDELILMPGSLMTALTGGWMPPLYHQVRNHHIAGRLSLLYIVNLEVDGEVEPLAVAEGAEGADLKSQARLNAVRFGLPQAPI